MMGILGPYSPFLVGGSKLLQGGGPFGTLQGGGPPPPAPPRAHVCSCLVLLKARLKSKFKYIIK